MTNKKKSTHKKPGDKQNRQPRNRGSSYAKPDPKKNWKKDSVNTSDKKKGDKGGVHQPDKQDDHTKKPVKGGFNLDAFIARMKYQVPVSPQSNSKGSIVSVYNDVSECIFIGHHLLPYTAGGAAALGTMLTEAMEKDIATYDVKDIKLGGDDPDERAKVKAWLLEQWEYLQELYTHAAFHSRMGVVYINSLSDDTSQICMTADSWNSDLELLEDGFPIFQPLLTLVQTMNPVFVAQMPHAGRELPASYVVPFVPKKKRASLNTMKANITANSKDALNYLGKVGLLGLVKPFTRSMIQNFDSRIVVPVPDARGLFWYNQLVVTAADDAGTSWVTHSCGGNPLDGDDGDWIADRRYYYQADLIGRGEAYPLHALVRMLERYHATSNIIGILEVMVDNLYGVNVGNNEFCGFGLSSRGTTLSGLGGGWFTKLHGIFGAVLAQADYTNGTYSASVSVQHGSFNKLATSQSYSLAAWEVTAVTVRYLKEQTFFQRLFRGTKNSPVVSGMRDQKQGK
jgi:hypothetical protein